jgi:L-alanine-DL-glutamate epimerase-like enolase superfamily enzyme
VSRPPEAMAEEVLNVSRRGYHWMKYHIDNLQNVIDQTAAIEKVAPRGFKVHYDFNGDSNVEAVSLVLKEPEKFRVAGRIEDPVRDGDHDGYRVLRSKCALPIVVHHGAPNLDYFMLHQLCDGFMAGHAPVGEAIRLAAMAETTNTPFMLQQSGGTIIQAFPAHEAAVFKMATIDHVDACHLWKEDVTVETMPVVTGSVAVPDKPGLGVTLDLRNMPKRPGPSRAASWSGCATSTDCSFIFGSIPTLRALTCGFSTHRAAASGMPGTRAYTRDAHAPTCRASAFVASASSSCWGTGKVSESAFNSRFTVVASTSR